MILLQKGKRHHPQPWWSSEKLKTWHNWNTHGSKNLTGSGLTCTKSPPVPRKDWQQQIHWSSLRQILDVLMQCTWPWLCGCMACQTGLCVCNQVLNSGVNFIYSPSHQHVSKDSYIKHTPGHYQTDGSLGVSSRPDLHIRAWILHNTIGPAEIDFAMWQWY